MSDIAISVFFPFYNEETNISRVVNKATDALVALDADFELIIVNDGSSDRTGVIGDEIASKDNRIRVIHHATNLGYGAALQSGFRAATKPLVFYTDGDGQFDISQLGLILPLIKDADIVSCYRINRQDSFVRKLNAFCWTRLCCLLFGLKLRDLDCAFKLYRTSIFSDMKMASTGALIDTEILARAHRGGKKIVQAGVNHYSRISGSQTGANLSVILRAFRELFHLYIDIRKGD